MELYDPETGRSQLTGSSGAARVGHVAIALPDGHVLIAGGMSDLTSRTQEALALVELADPDTGALAAAEPTSVGRNQAAAVLLPDGRSLLLGGFSRFAEDGSGMLASAEVYVP